MKYDELLKTLGEFGKYQRLQYFMVCLVSITSAFHSMNMVFVGPTPEHRCVIGRLPSQIQNLSKDLMNELLHPKEGEKISTCLRHAINESYFEDGNVEKSLNQSQPIEQCSDGWWYSTEYYTSTIVSEWDLVCESAWLRSMASSLFFAGRLLGSILPCILADIFGRRPVFFISLGLQAIVGCVCAASVNIYMFLVLYFLQGVIQVSVYMSSYVLGMEAVGPSYRRITGNAINLFYALGQVLLAGLAFGLRRWRWIEVAISLPPLLFFTYWGFLPESIRWLMAHGRKEEAEKIIRKASKMNKVTITDNVIDSLEFDESGKGLSLHQLLKHPFYLKIALNVCFNWMVNSLVYYGLNLNTSNLHGNPYVNFIIAAFVEVPGLIVAILLLDKIGRRWLLFIFMSIGGAGCIGSALVPGEDLQWLVITLSMLGKLAITASYSTIYLVGAEVFPTVVRNAGLGLASVCARVGGILAPQVLLLGEVAAYPPLPLLLFGGLSVLAACLCLLLPETSGTNLPQDFDEAVMQFTNVGDNTAQRDSLLLQEKETVQTKVAEKA